MKHFVLKAAEADLVTVENVPIMKTGKFRLSVGGEQEFTKEDLEAAAAAPVTDNSVGLPRQGVGHTSELDDGEPALGTYQNLRVKATGQGHTLYADLHGVPRWLAKIMPSAYPSRSIEGERNYVSDNGITHRLAISAVKLLGVVVPGISTLEDLQHMYGSEMPQGTKILASFMDPKSKVIIVDKADDEIEVPEGTVRQVDPKALRKQLGLAEDAADAEVDARLAELKATADKVKADEEAAAEQKRKDDEAAAKKIADDAAAAQAAADAAKNVPEGMQLIDKETLASLQLAASRANDLHAAAEAGEMSQDIDFAIKEGKFPKSRREHYETLYKADKVGTKALFASMAPGIIPIEELGTSTDGEDLDKNGPAYDPSMVPVAVRAKVAAAAKDPQAHLTLVPGEMLSDKVG